MKKIFEPIKLGNLHIKNRLVRSATYEHGVAENGIIIPPALLDINRELAQGGIGLIITGMMAVNDTAPLRHTMIRIDLPNFVDDYLPITEAVHAADGKIVVQLSHCGVKGSLAADGLRIGASAHGDDARAMTKSEIASLINDFATAAQKCRAAGADGVQLHAAHGYLLSQFLSPYFNQRDDEYGGEISGRAKIIFDIYTAIRQTVGAAYPVMIKINYADMIDNGFTADECLWVCGELEKLGIDAVEISGGVPITPESRPIRPVSGEADEGYFAEPAIALAAKLSVPIISVGGYRTPSMIEHHLNRGNIAAISLCRPLICEPALANRWANGDLQKATCISCNRCFVNPKHGCPRNKQNKRPDYLKSIGLT